MVPKGRRPKASGEPPGGRPDRLSGPAQTAAVKDRDVARCRGQDRTRAPSVQPLALLQHTDDLAGVRPRHPRRCEDQERARPPPPIAPLSPPICSHCPSDCRPAPRDPAARRERRGRRARPPIRCRAARECVPACGRDHRARRCARPIGRGRRLPAPDSDRPGGASPACFHDGPRRAALLRRLVGEDAERRLQAVRQIADMVRRRAARFGVVGESSAFSRSASGAISGGKLLPDAAPAWRGIAASLSRHPERRQADPHLHQRRQHCGTRRAPPATSSVVSKRAARHPELARSAAARRRDRSWRGLRPSASAAMSGKRDAPHDIAQPLPFRRVARVNPPPCGVSVASTCPTASAGQALSAPSAVTCQYQPGRRCRKRWSAKMFITSSAPVGPGPAAAMRFSMSAIRRSSSWRSHRGAKDVRQKHRRRRVRRAHRRRGRLVGRKATELSFSPSPAISPGGLRRSPGRAWSR